MYTYEQRKKEVELYIKYGFALRAVIKELGYPTCEQSIRNWYKEYREKGELSQEYTSVNQYTAEQKDAAVKHYLEHGKFPMVAAPAVFVWHCPLCLLLICPARAIPVTF